MRYLPDRPLPVYAYLPGRDPHPSRDPEGHSYGEEEVPPPYLEPARWRESEPYLWGVDLYNQGYLWEAHEAWEGLWHVTKAHDDRLQSLHLQGLIQCAAAWLKIPMGQPRGLARLSELGAAKLSEVARDGGATFMGLDLVTFVAEVRAFASSGAEGVEGRPELELG